MKTFHEFNENINQLRGDLQTLDRQDAPKNKMNARIQSARMVSANREAEFKQKALDRQNNIKNKAAQIKQQRLDLQQQKLERQSQN